MSGFSSALYAGGVTHERHGEKRHKLRYRLSLFALDLDEIDALDAKLNLFSHNRAGLYALLDRDHANRARAPLKPQIERRLREAGLEPDGGAITLLTMPRLLGYAFNPLSVYFCRKRDGAMLALIYEVRNTFGARHSYLLPAPDGPGPIRQSCAKDFFVSPFLPMDLRYDFLVRAPGESVSVAMKVRRGEETVLTARFTGQRRPLSDAALLKAFAGDPLMTLKAIVGIHWEALKMWAKGVRYLGRGGGGSALDGGAVGLAGADAHHRGERQDPDLAVANLAGLGRH